MKNEPVFFSFMKRIVCIILLLLGVLQVFAQRGKVSINSGWEFQLNTQSNATRVSFPHTWNNIDATDETPGYFRGEGIYTRDIFISDEKRGKHISIYFEGANQITTLIVNGNTAGTHIGGYTGFSFDITPYVVFGKNNHFEIRVDNSYQQDIPPLSADFTFFGGIYRDVYLIYNDEIQFSNRHFGSDGVLISTPKVSEQTADILVKYFLQNNQPSNQKVLLETQLLAPDKKVLVTQKDTLLIPADNPAWTHSATIRLSKPILWSPDQPALYTVVSSIKSFTTGKQLDEISNALGIRWYHFSPDKGFFINGKPLKLIGTNRHQDFKDLGNALPDDMHVRDVMLLHQMGGNFLRVSHYPQDPTVLALCDRLGIICSVEIPIVNAITPSEAFTENSMHMLQEMVYQNYNHPSVVIWCYMNEVMLRPPFKKNSAAYDPYCKAVEKLAQILEDTLRIIDPERYTMIPFHGSYQEYEDAGLHEIPKIIGWNLYQGWYGGKIEDFAVFVDKVHTKYPDKSMIISEYGADVDPRMHSFRPERFDYTAEYAMQYHHFYRKAIMERPFIAGSNIWNLNDFYSEIREFAVPHINNKGITGIDREPKDGYLLYKAMLSKTPFVAIGMNAWKYRGGVADETGSCTQPVTVYSNQPTVLLKKDGKIIAKKEVQDYYATFQVPFTNGLQRIEVCSEAVNPALTDAIDIDFQLQPSVFTADNFPVKGLHMMLGSKRYFEDRASQLIWLPEQPYKKGSWGYIGGEARKQPTRFGSLPASEADIKETGNDGVFQTQRKGLTAFKADVPDGRYEVELYFAELDMQTAAEALAYNLGNDAIGGKEFTRIFDIHMNGEELAKSLNIAETFGPARLVVVKSQVYISGNQGLNISFTPIAGETVLNAIRLHKIF